MRRKVLPLILVAAVAVLVMTGLLGAFDALSDNFRPPGPGNGIWTAAEISAEGAVNEPVLLFTVEGAAHTSYLRAMATTCYNPMTGVWRLDSARPHQQYDGGTASQWVREPPEDFQFVMVDDITVSGLSTSGYHHRPAPVMTSLYPESVAWPESLVHFPEEDVFLSQEILAGSYSFTTFHYSFAEIVLKQAQAAGDPIYLDLPGGISHRTTALAWNITGGLQSPYEKARALERYLDQNYLYDPDYTRAPLGREPNDWFLFEEKRGVCANFNSAFVVLCRAVGIPARLVSGYSIIPQMQAQEVYADQAHAWSEIALEGLGWITIDATGSRRPFPLMPTRTTITGMSGGETFQKGDTLVIEGIVEVPLTHPDPSVPTELPLPNMDVGIHLGSQIMLGAGSLAAQGTTGPDGTFRIECQVPVHLSAGPNQVVAQAFSTEVYLSSWSNQVFKVASDTSIEITLPDEMEPGEGTEITVALREEPDYLGPGEGPYDRVKVWNPVPGKEVHVYINEKPAGTLRTDSTGKCTIMADFELGSHTVRAEFKGTEHHFASNQEIPITLAPPASFSWAFCYIVLGLAAALLMYVLYSLRPGNPGRRPSPFFPLVLTGLSVALYLVYREQAYHWLWVALVPAAAWFLWRLVFLVRLRWQGGLFHHASPGPGHADDPRPLEEEIEKAGEALPPHLHKTARRGRLAIDFPQIGEAFPDVWGTGEELRIVCYAQNGETRTGGAMEFYLDGELRDRAGVDEGKGAFSLIINGKGEYVVGGRLEKAKGERVIRIVDYREEIVGVFNSLLQRFQATGTPMPDEATPRELEARLLETLWSDRHSRRSGDGETSGGTEDAGALLDLIITCFEEALYSLHPITRAHYEKMFLAQKALFSEEGA